MELAARTAAWSGKSLPYLRRVAYIRGNGNQYLNIGSSLDFDEITLDVANVGSSGVRQFVAGCGSSGSQYLEITTSGYWGSRSSGLVAWEYGQRVKVNCKHNGGIYVDEILSYGTNSLGIIGSSISDLCVMKTLNFGVPSKNMLYGIECGGSRTLDLIPVLDLSGRPCMYNQAPLAVPADDPSRFFYNQGTGEFTWGELGT